MPFRYTVPPVFDRLLSDAERGRRAVYKSRQDSSTRQNMLPARKEQLLRESLVRLTATVPLNRSPVHNRATDFHQIMASARAS